MTVLERFLRYVAMDTQSDEASETCPSTAKQLVLGKALVEEMQALGVKRFSLIRISARTITRIATGTLM